ncbi:hypothetical protein C8R44DRAFT_773504 [Mycena epipterygia]|nr:hypothetical protein C8R44DRAFT_773504 [Mycena epipterygia]
MDSTAGTLSVQCSQSNVLVILRNYFQKHSTRSFTISAGTRLFTDEDQFTISSGNLGTTPPVNPALILAFVEGVLKYELVHTNGSSWMYRARTFHNSSATGAGSADTSTHYGYDDY